MDGLQARLDSFKKSKRVKNPNKSTATLKWPHPLDFTANPATLADAGFYYDPSYDDPDNVTCFNCEKQLAGWEEDDDPYLVHWNKCSHSCCWAVVQCGLKADMDRSGKFVFPDKTRLPNHKTMEKARLESFTLGKGWAHDQTRNHGANSKSMARAGFTYTPHETGDDLATCLYCNVALSGWEEEDDPMQEHRKRASKSDINCPFFEHTESRQTKPSSSKPPSKSTRGLGAKTPAKSRSRSRKSSAKTPRSKSRSASRSGLKDVAEEVEDDEEATEAPPTVKKKTRSASKSVPKSEALTQSDIEVEAVEAEMPAEAKKKSRARSKSVARSQTLLQSDGEDEVPPTIRKPARSRAKSKAPIGVEEDEEEEPIRKSSRSKSKVAAGSKDDDVVPPRKASRKSSKPKVVEDDKAESVTHSALRAKPPQTAASHRRTGSRSRPKPPEVESDVEQVFTTAAATKPAADTKSKTRSQSRPDPDTKDLFNDHVVVMDEYVPPPSSPSPTRQSTTNKLAPLLVPKRKKDEGNLPTRGSLEATPAAPSGKEAERAKRKSGRPPKARATSQKQANKVVEVSSDEEEVEQRDHPTPNETKTRTVAPIETSGPPSLPAVNSFKDSEQHSLQRSQPVEDAMDVSMHDAEPGIQETVTDTEQELHTAPSTPPKPVFPEENLDHASHLDAPQSILQTSDDKSEVQPDITSNTTLALTTDPLYLPPLSRLPFMPLETLSEAELDMTVEEWIRYQIEVEQDRFKRDGERELERFKKRAEEVRKTIESL